MKDIAMCLILKTSDEELVVSNKLYLYEPEYTDEELREMDAQRADRERASVETAPTGAAVENRERASGDWWCQCRKSQKMATDEELSRVSAGVVMSKPAARSQS